MPSHPTCLIVILGLMTAGLVESRIANAEDPAPAEQEAFFERTVRPILVARCFECHGEKKQEGGLRLDSRTSLLHAGDNGPAIVVGKADESRLMQVVGYEGDTKMPPKGKLPDDEIAALRTWITQGAVFPEALAATGPALGAMATAGGIAESRITHWSYQPIQRPELPDVKDKSWPRNPLDTLILARLESAGLTASPQADPRTLLRRTTFDLLGLPPTMEEVLEFEADGSPDASARVLDRLLASPHYGERWGRHWLDIARYADTKGYVFTEERKYPYSYTYRDYVIDALNRDVPFDRFVLEQLAADQLADGETSALAAMGFLTVGRRFGNNQHDIIDDRIDVVTRGLLGLTVTCARCHDHKFDAIPTADYYSLYGIFASSVEPAELPQLGLPIDLEAYRIYVQELQRRQAAAQMFLTTSEEEIRDELRAMTGDYLAAVIRPDDTKPEGDRNGKPEVRGAPEVRGVIVQRWRNYLTSLAEKPHPVFGPWQALTQLPAEKFAEQSAELIAQLSDAADAQPRTNPAVKHALQAAPPATKEAVVLIYGELLSGVQAEWVKLRATGATALPDAHREELRQTLYAENTPPAISSEEARKLFDRAKRNKQRDLQRAVETHQATSPAAPPRAMVMHDAPQPMQPHIFIRGNPGRPGDPVPRQFLQVLQNEPQVFQQGSGRLELARAIVGPGNPLTARVIVNRVWQQHFGKGLVLTASDFGIRGEPPSHPELLDDLARTFLDGGWSLKGLHWQLLQSATYQQVSDDRPDGQQLDPENHLLWKMNRRRLEFEPLRDSVFAVAGQLDDRMAGRAVELFNSPPAPRRAVYGFIDRQDLPGTLRVFDFASPDVSTAQRAETTVPQQLLFGMNSGLVIEQARQLARRATDQAPFAAASQIDRLYQFAYSRSPLPEERAAAELFLTEGNSTPEIELGAWRYGYGFYDAARQRVTEFTPLPHFQDASWRGGPQVPDPKLGWVILNADGGHPGGTPRLAVIRRWVAPQAGVINIAGSLVHPAEQGDGVRGRIVSSRVGTLGAYTAFHGNAATNLERISVEADEVLDFVVDCLTQEAHDAFQWSPEILMVGKRIQHWSGKHDFHGPRVVLSPLEQLAQALLLANEFVFID